MRVVNLFSGCGGFACGAEQEGFSVVLAIDNDAILSSSFRRNFPSAKFLLSDVSKIDGDTIKNQVGIEVDGIIGGPPCQGFSVIGRRNPEDPRRQLIWHFFRLVTEVMPRFFVMENVSGLGYSGSREVLEGALGLVSNAYWVLGPFILDASEFGAATKRRRLFVVGIHKRASDPMVQSDLLGFRRRATTVSEAISDLKDAVFVSESDGFDVWRIGKSEEGSEYARERWTDDRTVTGHRKARHSPEVIARFCEVPQGGMDRVGRHSRLAWTGQCPTIRAGTGADRGSYLAVRPIHPEKARAITVREAARLQGFPDVHMFHPTIWHSFRMIGNSVSPLVAKAILGAIRRNLEGNVTAGRVGK